MTNILEVIRARRSVRAFRPEPVPDEHLTIILDAARYAPTAGNSQPWRFLVVRKRNNLERLRTHLERWTCKRIKALETNPEAQAERLKDAITYLDQVFAAPLFVFLFVEASEFPQMAAYDGALAAENLMLAARALGYGTCFQTTFFPEDVVRRHFNVPEKLRLICALPIGQPVEWPRTPPKKPLAEMVWYERMEG